MASFVAQYASCRAACYTDAMHRTTLVLDEKQLAKVKKILGTKGIKDTIDAAFAEIVAMEQRKRLVERLTSMDGLDLDDAKVMARAWR